jgi:Tol biopolymer transport system component
MLALLTFDPDDAAATFPGPAGRISFERGDDLREVYSMDAAGGGQTNLTTHPADDSEPRWSPDGSKLVFESDRTGNREVFVMDADGDTPVQLTEDAATDAEPSWSPDGSKIVFESDRDGNVEIYVMDASPGASPTRLTFHPMDDFEPMWSPDVTRILFHSDRDGSPDVFVMNANGSGQTNLTNNPASDDNGNWSPDSSRILFDSDRDDDFEIYVMNANGTGQTRITTTPGSDRQPVWSPDGTQIAFESDRDGNQEIYVMNAGGTNQTRLTFNTVLDSEPDWQPAGGDLTIDLTDNDHAWAANPLIPYVITVAAQAVPRTNLVVREIVPVNTTFSPADSTPGWTCDPGPQAESTCSFALGDLAAGESRTLTFTTRVADGLDPLYEVFNEASVNPGDAEITPRELVRICMCHFDLTPFCDEDESLSPPSGSPPLRRGIQSQGSGELDVILYYRARDRVLHKRPAGRRVTQLGYLHVNDVLNAVATAPELRTHIHDAFVAWQPVIRALVDGTGAAVTITDAQVQIVLALFEALRAASPALRPVIDRERILFDPSGLAGTTADQWLARLDRLSCERAQTFPSVRCQIDELVRLVEAGGASGATAKRLRATKGKAAKKAEAAERADAEGKVRPRRAGLRKVGAALAVFGRRLASKRAKRDVAEDLRVLLGDQAVALRGDVTALAGS